jgi:hypothetical protein
VAAQGILHLDDVPSSVSDVARLANPDLLDLATELARATSCLAGIFSRVCGELDRREAWRDDGATSLENWIVARTGASSSTARNQVQVAERLADLPHLAQALSTGQLSFDKVKTVSRTATPETDSELAETAASLSVRELAELARSRQARAGQPTAGERRSLRFNESCLSITAQLPQASFAEVRSALEARAAEVPSEGDTPLDERLADALVSMVRTGSAGATTASRYTVVAHIPLEALLDEESELLGEIERAGLVDAAVVRRVACDATVIIGVDDDAGHTMYEGRQRRFASDTQRRELMRRDRHCRFPGCEHVTFVVPHHIRLFAQPSRGPTDLPNLVLLCEHHHHLIHSKSWTMEGDANSELTFTGPSGRVMTSRPSPLWARVSTSRGS